MDVQRMSFEHDGHRFEITERQWAGSTSEPRIAWSVTMDGAPALDFEGPYPYRDADVRARVLEWYAIQRRGP
jgi:hypothetical protein